MRELLAFSRRSAAALVLFLGACTPELPETPTDKVVNAVFDPTTASIPLPNDLVFPPFNSNLNSVCPPPANVGEAVPRYRARAPSPTSITRVIIVVARCMRTSSLYEIQPDMLW